MSFIVDVFNLIDHPLKEIEEKERKEKEEKEKAANKISKQMTVKLKPKKKPQEDGGEQ